ncbi:hypothetical protein ACFT7S_16855 [Streptomyces sp. NPDC057136]|uniref:hypothetical protein n=1 Tax=Streptomyces sp. NPDC057136 TaxID=3346029 RepID=UPI00362AFBF2
MEPFAVPVSDSALYGVEAAAQRGVFVVAGLFRSRVDVPVAGRTPRDEPFLRLYRRPALRTRHDLAAGGQR